MKPIIPKLEYDVVDHCNLGCSFCIHNSQLKPKAELDITVVEDELKCLFDKFDVKHLCLKGGEPLIHSNINGVISTVKKSIGDAELSIATNGIRLATLPTSFFLLVKHFNIHLTISEYGVNIDYEKIYSNLRERGIQFSMEKKIVFWDFLDPAGKQNPEESFTDCRKKQFYPLYRDKRFWLCCLVYDVPFVNKHFGYKVEGNSVSIDDDVNVILDYLGKHCSTCRFCSSCIKDPQPWQKHKK